VAAELFDMELRALRRDRACRTGPTLFLHERAFADVLERIAMVHRRFRSALLIGCPDPGWSARLGEFADMGEVVDPGPLFATAAGGERIIEEAMPLDANRYDLCVAVGTLDTVNDLPLALRLIRSAMQPDSLLIGAISGGDTLPRLRSALRAADEVAGVSAPHVHPRIEPAALGTLLTSTGFVMPVVDVDRVRVSYDGLRGLVDDLRAMGATNILRSRPRLPLLRAALAAAEAKFADAAKSGRTVETFELLHFAAWTPTEFNG
jgi:NADH dehydrogenase [ubiquinone] 1 alpha subcomplex assembly factor 5